MKFLNNKLTEINKHSKVKVLIKIGTNCIKKPLKCGISCHDLKYVSSLLFLVTASFVSTFDT